MVNRFYLTKNSTKVNGRISSIMSKDLKNASSNTNISKVVINGLTIQYGRVTNMSNTTITLAAPYTSATTYVGLYGARYNTSSEWKPNSINLTSSTQIALSAPNGSSVTYYWMTIGY